MVCNISDVPLDTMKGFNVKDNYVLVANVDDNFYVVDAVCPHMSGFIPVGKLENNFIISSLHTVLSMMLALENLLKITWIKKSLPKILSRQLIKKALEN